MTVTVLEFLRLFPEFGADSWRGWRSVTAALFGLEPEDPDLVRRLTGRSVLPSTPAPESYWVIGRGAGKSRQSAVLANYCGAAREYRRAAGERIYVLVIAPTRQQAAVTRNYAEGLLRSTPVLERLIINVTQQAIELSTGVIIEVVTPDYRYVRGRAVALAIVEEGAFLPTDDSATPDTELLRALRPALARVPGSMLLFISSPYARRGELYRAWREHFGNDNSSTLVVQADTLTLNPTFDPHAIEKAYADDPAAAASEYGAEFRTDIESIFTRECIESSVVPGRRELPPDGLSERKAVLDFAGGTGTDSAVLGIGHRELRGDQDVLVLDCVREIRPPFSPQAVCSEFAAVMKSYGLTHAVSDKWAGQFPIEEMQKHGILVEPSARPKSDCYRDLLPIINSGRVELLDHPRLIAQLVSLERRVARGGRDSIDHPPGGHDDLANVLALLADVTAAQGLPALPAMQGCNREQSGLPVGCCYLWSEPGNYGAYLPSGCPACAACIGHQAVLVAWRSDSQGLDLRAYRWARFGDNALVRRKQGEAGDRWLDAMGF